MGKADGLAVEQRNQALRLELAFGEEPFPGGRINLLRDLRVIEFEIGGPQPPPVGMVGLFQRADYQAHASPPSFGRALSVPIQFSGMAARRFGPAPYLFLTTTQAPPALCSFWQMVSALARPSTPTLTA